MFTFYPDVFCEPHIVLYVYFFYVLDVVQACGSFPVAVRIVYLYFKPLVRKTGLLVGRVKIDPGIGTRLCHYLRFKFKVGKIVAQYRTVIIQVRANTCYFNSAVFNRKGARLLAGFPVIECLAVKQAYPVFVTFYFT